MQPWCSPDRIAEMRPIDLLNTVILFDVLYPSEDSAAPA